MRWPCRKPPIGDYDAYQFLQEVMPIVVDGACSDGWALPATIRMNGCAGFFWHSAAGRAAPGEPLLSGGVNRLLESARRLMSLVQPMRPPPALMVVNLLASK